jgi:disulfide bond formation protein DsbB
MLSSSSRRHCHHYLVIVVSKRGRRHHLTIITIIITIIIIIIIIIIAVNPYLEHTELQLHGPGGRPVGGGLVDLLARPEAGPADRHALQVADMPKRRGPW